MNQATLSQTQQLSVALAAMYQAVDCVIDIAHQGQSEIHDTRPLIDSLFCFEPEQTMDIYGNRLEHLHRGLKLLSSLSKPEDQKRANKLTRFIVNIVSIEKQLSKQPQMLSVIHSRLNHMQFHQQHFSLLHDKPDATHFSEGDQLGQANDYNALYKSLAGLYQDTISTLQFRIQVTGNMQYLSQSQYADQIRALLFSGIRAAMLWRQLGGSRWQLIVKRRVIESDAQRLLMQ